MEAQVEAKKDSILKSVENEVESNGKMIDEIKSIISNFEEVLGCQCPEMTVEKAELHDGRLGALKTNLYSEHLELLNIRDRLNKLKENFE